MRITIFAVLSDHLRVVELIVDQKALRVLVDIDVDLGQSVVQFGSLHTFIGAGFQPRLQDSQLISALNFLDQLFNGTVSTNVVQKLLDVGFITFQIDQRTEHFRRGGGVDSEQIHFNEFVQVILVQVLGQFGDITVLVTQEDQRTRVGQSSFLKVVLDLNGIIEAGFLNDSLNFLDLVQLGGGFNILEVDIFVFQVVDDTSQEVEQTVEVSIRLEHLDQRRDANLLMVTNSTLHNSLQVLSVGFHQLVKAFQSILGSLSSQKFVNLLGSETVGGQRVDDNSLDVGNLSVVVQSVQEHTLSFAKLGDLGLIIMSKHVHFQNCLGNSGSGHQVQLQQTGLQMTFLRAVTLQGLDQEFGGLKQFVVSHEDVDDNLQINLGSSASLTNSEHLSQSQSTFRVGQNNSLEQVSPFRGVVDLLTVGSNFFELFGFDETFQHSGRGVGSQVNGKTQIVIELFAQVTQFFGAFQLVFLEPVFNHVSAALL
mmetsp:Transcript_27003/g.31126  ORF Transcript_27003/g.31126 Transcript_27003/m.31126 type:complete len:481 (-) Transcript_27003:1285-2727(-)